MHKCSALFLSMFFMLAAQAGAQENASFKDWLSVTSTLKSKGIEPTQVNWHPIEMMCVGLKEMSDNTAYNKCKYEKASEQFFHRSDRQQCAAQSVAEYPDSLTKDTTTQTLRKKDSSGRIYTLEQIVHPISNAELASQRYGFITQCMQNIGWANADNPLAGKRLVE